MPPLTLMSRPVGVAEGALIHIGADCCEVAGAEPACRVGHKGGSGHYGERDSDENSSINGTASRGSCT